MPADAAPAGGEEPQSWEDRAWRIGKQVLLFIGMQYAIKQFMGSGQQQTAAPKTNPDGTKAPEIDYSITPMAVRPFWPTNTSVDVSMYISDSLIIPPLHRMPSENLVVSEKGFPLDGKSEPRELHTSFSVPKHVQDNGTLWAHIFVGQAGAELDPASQQYDPTKAYRMLRPLTQYLGRKKQHKTRNLLEAQDEVEIEEQVEEDNSPTIASYYHPNFTLSFIPDAGQVVMNSLHPAVKQFYTLDQTNSRDESGKYGFYYPILYLNTFWQLRSQMTELNATHPIDRLDLNVGISTLKSWQFQVMASMDEGMKETARRSAQGQTTAGGGDGSELELVKETLLDTNPWLLGTTAIVSMLHMVFELLAFKSDVGHWRNKKDNVGVSVRSILSNVFMQSVIFLYLLDNNENTSWMILFGQGMGIAVEAWKITKTVNVRVREPTQESFFYGKLPYVVVFEDKHQLSETEEKTEEYDKIAFKWMGIGAVPLLLAYAGYSLVYDTHKSWYSFIITTLVGSVYAYGFLMMVCPTEAMTSWQAFADSTLGSIPLHKLPPQIRRAHARQSHDVQIPQHLHRRPLRLHHQDAHAASPRHAARRCHFLRLPVPGVEV